MKYPERHQRAIDDSDDLEPHTHPRPRETTPATEWRRTAEERAMVEQPRSRGNGVRRIDCTAHPERTEDLRHPPGLERRLRADAP